MELEWEEARGGRVSEGAISTWQLMPPFVPAGQKASRMVTQHGSRSPTSENNPLNHGVRTAAGLA